MLLLIMLLLLLYFYDYYVLKQRQKSTHAKACNLPDVERNNSGEILFLTSVSSRCAKVNGVNYDLYFIHLSSPC